jgi:hypothetical protein
MDKFSNISPAEIESTIEKGHRHDPGGRFRLHCGWLLRLNG